MPHLYILLCKDGTYYTGCATNLEARLKQHQSGVGAKYTRGRRPVELVYSEEHDSLADAMRRENQLKRWPKKRKKELIEKKSE